MKSFRKSGIALLLVFTLAIGVFSASGSIAASKNRKAGVAFAAALSNGSIGYDANSTFSIGDMNGDGVKDLLIVKRGTAKVYSYKSGSVKTILKYYPEYSLGYDVAKKVFWEVGEGDGSWRIALKLKNGSLVEQYRYYSEYGSGDTLTYYYQKVGKNPKKITAAKYSKISKRAAKSESTLSKEDLIEKLNNLN